MILIVGYIIVQFYQNCRSCNGFAGFLDFQGLLNGTCIFLLFYVLDNVNCCHIIVPTNRHYRSCHGFVVGYSLDVTDFEWYTINFFDGIIGTKIADNVLISIFRNSDI